MGKIIETQGMTLEYPMDNDSLLLWKVLKRTLNINKIFDIIDAEYPNTTKSKPMYEHIVTYSRRLTTVEGTSKVTATKTEKMRWIIPERN